MRNKLFQKILEQAPEYSRVFVRKYTDIIDRIYDLMEEKGYLQKDLAQKLGKQESEISRWLKGDHNLTLRTIAKLEAALGEEIITVPRKKEVSRFVGWKKTQVATMHIHVGQPSVTSKYQSGRIKSISSEERKVIAV
jgi:transcriptional regulator with XRE-family HTH domain